MFLIGETVIGNLLYSKIEYYITNLNDVFIIENKDLHRYDIKEITGEEKRLVLELYRLRSKSNDRL